MEKERKERKLWKRSWKKQEEIKKMKNWHTITNLSTTNPVVLRDVKEKGRKKIKLRNKTLKKEKELMLETRCGDYVVIIK